MLLRRLVPAVLSFVSPLSLLGQCQPGWLPGDAVSGTNGTIRAGVVHDDGSGPAVYLVGLFSVAGNVPANCVARWDGAEWSSVGTEELGVWKSGTGPWAAASYQGELYIGGEFGMPFASYVAAWNGMQWHAVGAGTGRVSAMTVHDGSLFAATFEGALRRWDGVAWSVPPGGGVVPLWSSIPPIRAMATFKRELVVAGLFESAGGVQASNIARWDGAAWHPLGPGLFGAGGNNVVPNVYVLGEFQGDLIAGGPFRYSGAQQLNGIARWDGEAWHSLATGVTWSFPYVGPYVSGLAEFSGDLVVSGGFTTAGGVNAPGIGRWDGSSWHAVEGALVAGGPLFPLGERLVVTASLSQYNGIRSDAAEWDGREWFHTGTAFVGSPATLLRRADMLTAAIGLDVIEQRAGRWELFARAQKDYPLGSPGVYTLYEHAGHLYAGGTFDRIESVPAENIARWNGLTWQPLGPGLTGGESFGSVRTLRVFRGDLIAGGYLTYAGTQWIFHIARWTGTDWVSLGTGVDGGAYGGVRALQVYGDDLIAGGKFENAGGIWVSHIARWDGAQWHPLGSGITGGLGSSSSPWSAPVAALALYEGDLIAAGNLQAAGGTSAAGVARWDGIQWYPLGAGITQSTGFAALVNAVTQHGSDLFATGQFDMAGGSPALNIARWDGLGWHAMGSGLEFTAQVPGGSFLAFPHGQALLSTPSTLLVGGDFITAGGVGSPYLARWGCGCYPDCNSDGALTPHDFTCFQSAFVGQDPTPTVTTMERTRSRISGAFRRRSSRVARSRAVGTDLKPVVGRVSGLQSQFLEGRST